MKAILFVTSIMFPLAMFSESCVQKQEENKESTHEYQESSISVSGRRLRSEDPNHAEFFEEFRSNGEWVGTFHMAGPMMLFGTWSQSGEKICVSVSSGEFNSGVVGSEVCRELNVRRNKLFFSDIRDKETNVPVMAENI